MGASSSALNKSSTAHAVVEHFARAAAVPAGALLAGKTALVTGGNSGIGLETVKALSAAGCRVIATSRDVAAGQRAITAELLGGPRAATPYAGRSELVSVLPLDLERLESVRDLAAAVAAEPLDLVILNAGIMALETREDVGGWEKQLATNGFGHWYLASLLRAQLAARAAPSRVIFLSSLAHKRGGVDVADLHFAKGRKYEPWVAYGQSKKANMLHARELADQLATTAPHVTAVSLHPGIIVTNLARHMSVLKNPVVQFIFSRLIADKTIGQGAATTLFCALAPVEAGAYYADCAVAAADAEGTDADKRGRRALWAETERQVAAALAARGIA